ncbi:[FeFe] hydrogenase H-cluster maturation GTPase HydF [Desulforamulus hydrothermalis]|uniref:Small GTP-binding protein n=1 Tax=Desulforamulus hydrothermalis Lam5 = DSM 18033 TaxID=1121428 RepID=K8E6B3_9FIRM|nr:[FeFe] hydrogenase H-cluster maturation GTPase HydF [Desulforamulus hydrothermalis]CCO07003.1 Small GTP-binding protein [Desulforamulus hydrothermalis Lam5 = DSM 18033]SHG97855.1 iron-only hydrogenase maturation protein HydF [Desulforamulus hydrothermalis Lam5 = DSM 18033]
MDSTPRGNRLHIAIFGRRNAGKSSLINALTNQDIAVVSHVPGTTTDPVYKAMEILPVGPVVIIDTAGIDDTGQLGELRVQRSLEVLNKADLVLLVMDAGAGLSEFEQDIVSRCQTKKLPVVAVLNKTDQYPVNQQQVDEIKEKLALEPVAVSALTGTGISELKIAIIKAAPPAWDDQTIVGDLLNPGDVAVLVVPIDLAAPKGRLILPQVQTIRDILDHDAMAYVVKERELKECIASLNKKPRIVITDSQAFLKADADTPPDVLLTSFSILFARYKGDLETLVAGAKAIEKLKPGDKVLIAEACTHHRMEDDIGTVKIPRWLRQIVGGDLDFHWCSGHRFPADLSEYKLVVHCGSCMINRREMLSRIMQVQQAGVPIVNYGVCIAYVQGILRRALSPFPVLQEMLDDLD